MPSQAENSRLHGSLWQKTNLLMKTIRTNNSERSVPAFNPKRIHIPKAVDFQGLELIENRRAELEGAIHAQTLFALKCMTIAFNGEEDASKLEKAVFEEIDFSRQRLGIMMVSEQLGVELMLQRRKNNGQMKAIGAKVTLESEIGALAREILSQRAFANGIETSIIMPVLINDIRAFQTPLSKFKDSYSWSKSNPSAQLTSLDGKPVATLSKEGIYSLDNRYSVHPTIKGACYSLDFPQSMDYYPQRNVQLKGEQILPVISIDNITLADYPQFLSRYGINSSDIHTYFTIEQYPKYLKFFSSSEVTHENGGDAQLRLLPSMPYPEITFCTNLKPNPFVQITYDKYWNILTVNPATWVRTLASEINSYTKDHKANKVYSGVFCPPQFANLWQSELKSE